MFILLCLLLITVSAVSKCVLTCSVHVFDHESIVGWNIILVGMDKAEDMEVDKPANLQQGQSVQCSNNLSVTETEPAREDRTLTDHLNRRLLEHFMQRLDSNDPSFPKVDRIDTSDHEENLSNGVHKIEMNKN